MKKAYAIIVILSAIFITAVGVANAQWSAISSGYAVTTDYHGTDAPLGTVVTAIAGTTNTDVVNVTFLWKCNDVIQFRDENKPVRSNGTTYNGKLIYYANSSYRLDAIGDWGVQALFIGNSGTTKVDYPNVIKVRATSVNAVPDLPVVGTAGALVTMLFGLGLFLHKKRQ
jgi:hypothetical protein